MAKTTLFRGPVLKLERAKHHIEDLYSRCQDFYGKIRCEMYVLNDAQARQRSLCIDVDTTVPETFPLIMGDAIHNLRSALDHLTWDVISPFNPPRPKDVMFPFCAKAESFEGLLVQRQIKIASEEIVEKFRKLKPYPGGNDLLYDLHTLDIADKHQLIVPVVSAPAFDRLKIRDIDESAPDDLVIENLSFINIAKNNRLATWRYDPSLPRARFNNNANLNVAFDIRFRKDQTLTGKGVAFFLRSLAIMVEGAIDSFTH